MQAQGQVLYNSSLIGSTTTTAITWPGGRTAVTVAASQYGTSVSLQLQAYNQKWVPICSSFVADQVFAFDAPAGQYRLAQAGSSVGLSATMNIIY